MNRKARIYYTDKQKALMWDRWQKGDSMHEIASQLSRSSSTVSREVKRNGGYASYRASFAENAAWQRALRPKACKLAGQPDLVRLIIENLQEQWFPDQIAGWLKRQYRGRVWERLRMRYRLVSVPLP